jgi:heterodisulfide reductase subunit A
MHNQSPSKNINIEKMEHDRPKIGVYVCHCGGNISDIVDIDQVVEAVSRFPDVTVAKRNLFMCSDPGQNMITEDIERSKINRVVVAACSPSLHELTFRKTLSRAGLNPYLFEHVNIREQVSWVSQSDAQGAIDKAIRLIASGIAKARYLKPLKPIRTEAKQQVVVVGGGISGLRCSLDLSRRGFSVTLLERSAFLGGCVARLGRTYPTEKKGRELLDTLLNDVVHKENITIYTQAEVVNFSGYTGNFHLTVQLKPRGINKKHDLEKIYTETNHLSNTVENEFDYGLSERKAIYKPYNGCFPALPAVDWHLFKQSNSLNHAFKKENIVLDEENKEIEIKAGAIVMATGIDPYEPKKDEFGYGKYPEVITLPQLKRLLDVEGPTSGKVERNGRPIKNICFIHCVGSRQIEGIHEPGPDGSLNSYCSRYCCTATLQAVNEICEQFPNINLYDFYQDIRTYGRGHEDYFEKASENGVLFFRYNPEEPPKVIKSAKEDDAPLIVQVNDLLTFKEELEVPADLVVLSTGMVPSKIHGLIEKLKLPRSADGFLQEVHPKLRPVELAVEGIFIAGSCQGPMDITESCASASAAAAKVSSLLGRGYIESDPFVAYVDPDKCCGTGACIEECGFVNAISLVERRVDGKIMQQAEVNAAVCKGCGMCVPVCPHNAIEVEGWRIDQYDAMVDAIASEL